MSVWIPALHAGMTESRSCTRTDRGLYPSYFQRRLVYGIDRKCACVECRRSVGSDLHGFIEQYERAYPDEVRHIEEPLRAEWEIAALAMKLEKAHRFPLLVLH